MNKTILVAVICLVTATGASFGQTQKLSFNDNNGTANAGTYGPNDTFSIDISLKYSGYSSFGLSYWLEAQNGLAPNISITSITYFKFPDPNQTVLNPTLFNDASGADNGYLTESTDLGALVTNFARPVRAGSYKIATIQFTLTGAAPGTYMLKSTTLNPRSSEVTDSNFASHNIGASAYRITIASPSASTNTIAAVPEPTTFSLLGLAATGFGLAAYRRRRADS